MSGSKKPNISTPASKRRRAAVKALREIGQSDESIAATLGCDVEDVVVTAGRRAIIDLDILTNMCKIGSTDEEIAGVFGVNVKTIERRKKSKKFREAMEHGRAIGKTSLRRSQWNLAEDGNPTMQIWLGKQMLGQKQHPVEQRQRGGTFRVVFDKKGDESKQRHKDRLAKRRAAREKSEDAEVVTD